jgi:glycosyltransferase involved in cell wall biosynthesis
MSFKNHKILFVGHFNRLSSISIINNTLSTLLLAEGFDIQTTEKISQIHENKKFDMIIVHNWPPVLNLEKFPNSKKCIILPWEYEAIPLQWVSPLNHILDEIWVPSKFVKQSLVNSNVKKEKIKVIPNGYNPEIFHISETEDKVVQTEKKFKFLFVGGTIRRKGIDILLEAYINIFSCKDDVTLIIKDFGTDSFYMNQNFIHRIDEIKKMPNSPEIIYINRNLKESELASLYNYSSCLVHPYRGEGFGLPVLEAMACGKPVIVTKGGATDDFCKEEHSYLIDAFKVKHKMKGLNLVKPKIDINTPKINHLKLLMFHVYQNREEAYSKGLKACNFVRKHYTWKEIGKKYFERIMSLLSNKNTIKQI